MTLIVSLTTPDGIVLAGDSLSTMVSNQQIEGNVHTTCPICNHSHTLKAKIPSTFRSNSLSYAEKIFPFLDIFGIGTFGVSQFSGKSVYFIMRELEKELRHSGKSNYTTSEIANIIGEHMKLFISDEGSQALNPSGIIVQGTFYPLGFQIIGYDDHIPQTIIMHIGDDINKKTLNECGICYTGQKEVTNALFARFESKPEDRPIFQFFSLQDAVIYAEFLIKTTSTYQRFSSNMATVGGEIDVAFVTPFDGFKWIKQKSLQAKLSGDNHT